MLPIREHSNKNCFLKKSHPSVFLTLSHTTPFGRLTHMTGLIIILASILAAYLFVIYRKKIDGKLLNPHQSKYKTFPLDDEMFTKSNASSAVTHRSNNFWNTPPARTTLVQFSTHTCTPCSRARTIWLDLTEKYPNQIRWVEIDAAQKVELLQKLHITRTPTTLVVDSENGKIVHTILNIPTNETLETLTTQ